MKRLYVLLAAVIVCACETTPNPPITQLPFSAADEQGLVFRGSVAGVKTTHTVVRVDLENQTYGESIELGRSAFGPIYAASNATGLTRGLHYEGYYLEPGYYAVLHLATSNFDGYRTAREVFCFAERTEVFEVKPGAVHLLWAQPGRMVMNRNTMGAQTGVERQRQRFMDSVVGLELFDPAAITSTAVGMVQFELTPDSDAWDCTPQAMKVLFRTDDHAQEEVEAQPVVR